MEQFIDSTEYDKLIKRIEFFDVTRNNLLSFSFTAVLAALGATLIVENEFISSLICLVPFFLIIPFAARISYYRLATAHISSFLRVFAKNKMKFEIATKEVPEGKCKHYKLISWLVNHEMFLLGLACSCTFYIKFLNCIQTWNLWDCIIMIVPVLLNIMVFTLSNATSDFAMLITKFSDDWLVYHIEEAVDLQS